MLVTGLMSLAGCGGEGSGSRLRVGNEPGTDGGAAAGAGGGAGASGASGAAGGGVGSSDNALSVHVLDAAGLRITIVTLSCDAECAQIEAVASGGNPPYAFAWDDGSTEPVRRVCPEASGALSVSATDTGIESDEFVYEVHTARTVVTARVVDCSDAGVDGGALCLDNPSIEGTPGLPLLSVFDAAPWDACVATGAGHVYAGNDALNGGNVMLLPAQDGLTYGVVSQDSGFGGRGTLAQGLCAPIEAGAQVSFLVDLARAPKTGTVDAEQAVLEVRGGAAPCAEQESLWLSAPLDDAWTTHCVTLRPGARVESLAFTLYGDGGELFTGLASVMIDHIVPVDACP
jgi:hypothetical protein